MGHQQIPKYLAPTAKAWRAQKRREWRAVLKAMNTYRLGCAATPGYLEFLAIKQKADDLSAQLRGTWRKW